MLFIICISCYAFHSLNFSLCISFAAFIFCIKFLLKFDILFLLFNFSLSARSILCIICIMHKLLIVYFMHCNTLCIEHWYKPSKNLNIFYRKNCITLLGMDVSGTLQFNKLKPLIHLNICINKYETSIMWYLKYDAVPWICR